MANRGANLLAKDDDRAALADEPEPLRPQVPGVGGSFLLAGRAERLAGAGAGPHGAIVSPSGATQGVAPHSDSGEEMTLGISHKVICPDIGNRAFIDIPRRDQIFGDEIPQPLGSEGVELVVIRSHSLPRLPQQTHGLGIPAVIAHAIEFPDALDATGLAVSHRDVGFGMVRAFAGAGDGLGIDAGSHFIPPYLR
jgi:hypothetical protein